MGIFHLVCPASGLGIVIEDVVLVLVAEEHGQFAPIAPPIPGNYNSYGSIDYEGDEAADRRILQGFSGLKEQGHLTIEAEDLDNLSGPPSVDDIQALIDDLRQGQVDTTWVRALGQRVGFVLVLESIYNAAVATARASAEGKQLEARLAALPFDDLVAASLHPGPLAAALVEDTKATRAALIELALFRSWFDKHGKWTPKPIGDQYSGTDLRRRASAARKQLAPWPRLVAAVDDYVKNIQRDG